MTVMAQHTDEREEKKAMGGFGPIRLLRRLYCLPIILYRKTLSGALLRSCRFEPSCSAYALGAIETHGIIVGTLLGAWRILRCNPFGGCGEDPVPEYGAFFWEKWFLGLRGWLCRRRSENKESIKKKEKDKE